MNNKDRQTTTKNWETPEIIDLDIDLGTEGAKAAFSKELNSGIGVS